MNQLIIGPLIKTSKRGISLACSDGRALALKDNDV